MGGAETEMWEEMSHVGVSTGILNLGGTGKRWVSFGRHIQQTSQWGCKGKTWCKNKCYFTMLLVVWRWSGAFALNEKFELSK